MTDTTPATDAQITFWRETAALGPTKWEQALYLRIDAERERADSLATQLAERDADVVALREYIVVPLTYEGDGSQIGWECRACLAESRVSIRMVIHASDCILARPSPAAGRVLVDAERLEALEKWEWSRREACPSCGHAGEREGGYCTIVFGGSGNTCDCDASWHSALDAAGGVK